MIFKLSIFLIFKFSILSNFSNFLFYSAQQIEATFKAETDVNE
jgi:hypothetical protein